MPTRRRTFFTLVNALGLLTLLLGVAAGPAQAQGSAAGAADADGARVIVKYKALGRLMRESAASAGASPRGPQQAAALGRRVGLSLSDGRAIDARTQVLRARGLSSQQLAAQLAADDEVEYAVPDQRRRALAVPNDPLFAASSLISPQAGQWYLRAPDATRVSAIDAAGAWDVTTGLPDGGGGRGRHRGAARPPRPGRAAFARLRLHRRRE
jgi:serine protease